MVLALALGAIFGAVLLTIGFYLFKLANRPQGIWIAAVGAIASLGSLGLLCYSSFASTPILTRAPISLPPAWTATPTSAAPSTPVPQSTGQPVGKPPATERATWDPCSGAPPSRLQIDDGAFVSYEPVLPNRLRAAPDMQESEVVGKITPGTRVSIIDGPTCNNEMVWWYVEVVGTGLQGWTSEGDKAAYWLIPIAPSSTDQSFTDW